MTPETRKDFTEAFIKEAKAHFRLLAYADKAGEEGYPRMELLFRAVALAEGVHARRHLERLEEVGSTEENVRHAFEKGDFVNEVDYPRLLRRAWAEEDGAAIWLLTKARNTEERHARLYKFALDHMVAERSTVYFVCSNCGWIEDGSRPEACPNCEKPSESFVAVK